MQRGDRDPRGVRLGARMELPVRERFRARMGGSQGRIGGTTESPEREV